MNRRQFVAAAASGVVLSKWAAAPQARADEMPEKWRKVIDKGLEYLAKQQQRDGHWECNGGQYPTTATALAGMAMLMEGSTMREGKYSERIRKAVDWLIDRSQRNGLLGNPNNASESYRYMYGHGFTLLFLSCVHGEEEDADRRKKLEDVLTRAVEFTGKAQTNRGGWGYVSAADGQNFDEGSVTITQLQGLRAARNAGIVVPKKVIDEAVKYLEKCTTPRGGIIYSLAHGGMAAAGAERPPLTAAGVACAFSSGQYDSAFAKKWLEFCRTAIPVDKSGRDSFGHWEYTHYYYSQAIYILGDTGYAKLFPNSKPEDRLTWSKYREVVFDYLASRQGNDGSWTQGHIGAVFTTACHLTILQLDNATLPIYQR
ncbi:MAG: terpene cyclase/mutase family protein [Gemmataceae bacterium]|nr:terpene cyclase/mutase family protein [Gemmataceae bacterium]